MAECIAKSASTSTHSSPGASANLMRPKVTICTGLIKLFRRCIRSRTGLSEWCDIHDDSHSAENDGHGHFIQVFRQALNVLVPAHDLQQLEARSFRIAQTQANDNATNQKPQTLVVTDVFGQLEIEDTDDVVFQPSPTSQEAAKKEVREFEKAHTPASYEVEDDGEGWLFALHCLWADIDDVILFVRASRVQYSNGEIDLTAVSVATNTAIDLIRCAEDDFNNANLKKPKVYTVAGMDQHLCSLQFIENCSRDGIRPPPPSRECIVPLSAWPQVQDSFYHIYVLLSQNGAKHLPNGSGTIPITRPAWMGTFDPNFDWENTSPKSQFEQDAALSMDVIFTIGPYVQLANTPNDEELMKGMRDTLHDNPPVWLLFASWA
jgi:hypothetical protein